MGLNNISAKAIRTEKFTVTVSLGLLFLISAVYFYGFGKGMFFYQENKSLFIFSNEYLKNFTMKPGGLLEFIGNFLTQGYYNYMYGALIVSSSLILFSSVFIKIYKLLSAERSFSLFLILLPSCLLLLMQTHYDHSIHHSLGFLLVIIWFYISTGSGNKRFRFIPLIFYPFFYYLTGSFALIYLGLYIMYSLIYERGILRYLLPAFIITIAFITFMVFKELLFLQPADRLLRYPMPFTGLSRLPILFYLLGGYIIIFPFFVKVSGSIIAFRKFTMLIPVITMLVVFPGTVYLIRKQYDHSLADLMLLEKSVFEQKWDAIIAQHERSPLTDVTAQYYYNLALSEKGELCDRLFFGRQDFGAKSLTLPRDPEHINRSVYFYYTIGLVREAHHLAYESMVLYGYRPENIKMLVKTELISRNYRVAERYINLLKKTLRYRNWGRKYEKMLYNPSIINSDPELGEKTRLVPEKDFFVSRDDLQNIDIILLGNPGNKRAFEYMIARLLLEKEFKAVVNQVKKMKDMSYTSIPRHIEEAIVLFKSLDPELPYLGELTINPETELRFKQYKTTFNLNESIGNMSKPENEMKKEWEKTFWYYLQFK